MATDQERADAVGAQQVEAVSKLDHFILGVSIAICAYLAQTNPYAPLGLNEETFLLCTLLVFALSAACGFLRLEATAQVILMNANALAAQSGNQRAVWNAKAESHGRRAKLYYSFRNYLLFIGLACYLATKVWATYQSDGWIPV